MWNPAIYYKPGIRKENDILTMLPPILPHAALDESTGEDHGHIIPLKTTKNGVLSIHDLFYSTSYVEDKKMGSFLSEFFERRTREEMIPCLVSYNVLAFQIY